MFTCIYNLATIQGPHCTIIQLPLPCLRQPRGTGHSIHPLHCFPSQYLTDTVCEQAERMECKQAKLWKEVKKKAKIKSLLPSINHPANKWNYINLPVIIVLFPIPNFIYPKVSVELLFFFTVRSYAKVLVLIHKRSPPNMEDQW